MGYVVKSACVVAKVGEGDEAQYVHCYTHQPIPENTDREQVKMLLESGEIGKPEDGDVDPDESKPDGVRAILADVGDDKDKAQAALDEENAAEKPRKTLVDKLQAVLDKV